MPVVRVHVWPRGLAPALVLAVLIWRTDKVVDALWNAYERIDAEINHQRYAAENAAAEANRKD